jgi:hypothetical protein
MSPHKIVGACRGGVHSNPTAMSCPPGIEKVRQIIADALEKVNMATTTTCAVGHTSAGVVHVAQVATRSQHNHLLNRYVKLCCGRCHWLLHRHVVGLRVRRVEMACLTQHVAIAARGSYPAYGTSCARDNEDGGCFSCAGFVLPTHRIPLSHSLPTPSLHHSHSLARALRHWHMTKSTSDSNATQQLSSGQTKPSRSRTEVSSFFSFLFFFCVLSSLLTRPPSCAAPFLLPGLHTFGSFIHSLRPTVIS